MYSVNDRYMFTPGLQNVIKQLEIVENVVDWFDHIPLFVMKYDME